jgi:hypothetical protein
MRSRQHFVPINIKKKMNDVLLDLRPRLSQAIADYWRTREDQNRRQGKKGSKDHGSRSAVTGGAQMDGLIDLIGLILRQMGLRDDQIFRNKALELPGFFRPTKEWDLLVIKDGQLILALEAKSQVGPSFGNNFNNRTEEAMGSAVDLWTAYREGAFNKTIRPWVGYVFLLEDCLESRRPVKVKEPHFKVFPEFKEASYARRYELFCRKLIRERHYSSSAFILSNRVSGKKGQYEEPAEDLRFELFINSLMAHVAAY